MNNPPNVQFQCINRIAQVNQKQWDALWQTTYPFIQHTFLNALEQSESVGQDTGWYPYHLIGSIDEQLVFAMPLYLKMHSYGEYVFDWSLADAYQNSNLEYYPKLVNAIPFTPATGPRWVSAFPHKADQDKLLNDAIDFLKALSHDQGFSGLHLLFPQDNMAQTSLTARYGYQFHWFNRPQLDNSQPPYENFDDFLHTFTSRKRKNIRKERKIAQGFPLTIQRLTGDNISEADWQNFYQHYQTTYLKRSGHTGYLTEGFFLQLKNNPQTLLVKAEDEQHNTLAAALYFFDDTTLYGRYWGCAETFDNLHFEMCYYQGIEFAIEKGLTRFDAGAQGEHKIGRGFIPVLTHSWHWLAHPGFTQAFQQFSASEKIHIDSYLQDCRQHLPFQIEFAQERINQLATKGILN